MTVKQKATFMRNLLYLTDVIEKGSFTKTAQINGIKSPNLSAAIKNLEQELGLPLIVRKTTGITPTIAGQHLYDMVQTLKKQLETIEDLRLKPQQSIKITLYLPAEMDIQLEGFYRQYPHITLSITRQLAQFDIGVLGMPCPDLFDEYEIKEISVALGTFSQKINIAYKKDISNVMVVVDFLILQLQP